MNRRAGLASMMLLLGLGLASSCETTLRLGSRATSQSDGGTNDAGANDAGTNDASVDDASMSDASVDASLEGGTDAAVDGSLDDASSDAGAGADADVDGAADASLDGSADAGSDASTWPSTWTNVWSVTFDDGTSGDAYAVNGACGGQSIVTYDGEMVWAQSSDWNHLAYTIPSSSNGMARAFEIRVLAPTASTTGFMIGMLNTAETWNSVFHDGYAFEFPTGSPGAQTCTFDVGGYLRSRATMPWSNDKWYTIRVEENPTAGQYRAFVNGALLVSGPMTDLVMSGDLFVVHSNGGCPVDHVYVDYLAVEVGGTP